MISLIILTCAVVTIAVLFSMRREPEMPPSDETLRIINDLVRNSLPCDAEPDEEDPCRHENRIQVVQGFDWCPECGSIKNTPFDIWKSPEGKAPPAQKPTVYNPDFCSNCGEVIP